MHCSTGLASSSCTSVSSSVIVIFYKLRGANAKLNDLMGFYYKYILRPFKINAANAFLVVEKSAKVTVTVSGSLIKAVFWISEAFRAYF